MAWMPRNSGLDSLQAIVRDAVQPLRDGIDKLSSKVDILTSDHVKHEDIERLESKLSAVIEQQGARFLSKDVAEERYKGVMSRIVASEADITELKEANKAALGRNLQVGGFIVACAGFLFAIVDFITQHLH